MGEWALENLLRGGFDGAIYPVNPRYDELRGHRCYAALDELPEIPDLVIFALGDSRLEQALDDAVASSVPAAVIMSSLYLDDDVTPNLRDRVQEKINDAGMLVCGANGMGFYNIRDHVWACGFDSTMHKAPGSISLISHSGSGMSGIMDSDARLRINFACSTGNELAVTMDEYLDFVLDLPETRVVGLFIETARNPPGFRAALEKANAKQIPVVAIKVGRTEKSAQLTVSHSGAMAGDDATYDALFDRYGVQRVRDMDEFATTLILFDQLHPVGPGGLVSLHDSGGERQLMVDLCDEAGVPLTELDKDTVRSLREVLDPELPAVNPLDAWSRGGPDASQQMADALTVMMQDNEVAIGAVVHDRAPDGFIYGSYIQYMKNAREATGKPVALVAARQGTGCDDRVVPTTHEGYPVLDGVQSFLRGVRALLDYRDFLAKTSAPIAPADATLVAKLRNEISHSRTLSEAESMRLLQNFGLPATPFSLAKSEGELIDAAATHAFPLALKTAQSGILHKSDRGGVILELNDVEELVAAYRKIAATLGPQVVLAPMADNGVEMILGAKHDPQFGPVVVLGFGGVLAEVIHDVCFVLPPFDSAHARHCVDKLKLRALLDGVRGRPPCDIDAFCVTASRFSVMVDALGDVVREIDINPLIVHQEGCTAVDALVVGMRQE